MTTKVRALSLVAAHLGTDLTSLRCSGTRLRWRGLEGGDHVVQDHRGRCYRVDLVLESVCLRVGVMPACCL